MESARVARPLPQLTLLRSLRSLSRSLPRYFTDSQRQNHYCQACYGGLRDNARIELPDGTTCSKRSLQKLKNDAIPEEGWVQCDTCERWIHQVCALFNGRKNKNAVAYNCPSCHIEERKAKGNLKPSIKVKQGAELPKCTLSDFLEDGVQKHLEREYEILAKDKGVDLNKIEKVENLAIRVVSNIDKKQVVRDAMFARYKNMGYPSEFLSRSKCIMLFQKIDGADVLLFGMYVASAQRDMELLSDVKGAGGRGRLLRKGQQQQRPLLSAPGRPPASAAKGQQRRRQRPRSLR
jgi:E1A/CREB-binding protein